MEYKKYNCNSYNIHTIKTDKFKTVRMEIIFSMDVSKEKMPVYTFLADILSDSSKKYPHRKDIAIRLEELYKANFYSITNKVGNLFTTNFVLEFINPSYISEQDYLDAVLRFPFEIINNPLSKNKEFDETVFNIVKRRIKEEIESIKDDSNKYAILKALKTMDESSPSSFSILGNLNDLEKINTRNLYDAYEELINKSNCDIFIIGNINMEKTIEIIKNNYKNRSIKINKPKLIVNNSLRKKVLIKENNSNYVQSTLVMIYNIKDLSKDDKDIAFYVFNYILGSGGITSKLYKYLRTDNSLCYSVQSLYLKYDELLIVLVSLDDKNVKMAEKLIKKAIKDMINGNYDDETIENTTKNLIFSLKMGLDNNVSIINNYIFNYFDSLPLIDERIELIKKVTKNDLIRCGKSLVLNTIYVQKAGDENERN